MHRIIIIILIHIYVSNHNHKLLFRKLLHIEIINMLPFHKLLIFQHRNQLGYRGKWR